MSASSEPVPECGASQAEVLEYLETRVVRRRLFPRAIVVGLTSGGVAAVFRLALEAAERLRVGTVQALPLHPMAVAGIVALLAAIGTFVALIIGGWDKNAGGSGIPHMKAVLEGHSSMKGHRLIAVKFAAAVAAIGSGLALGREGPSVQMGGATGFALAEATGASSREQRALTAAGAGSGLAAAFNAPLSGVTFVLEELQRDFQPVVFAAALLSAAIATVVSRLVSGQVPAFEVPHIPAPSLAYIPVFIVIGALAGLLGILFNRGLLKSSALIEKLRAKSVVYVALLIGVLAGGAFLVSPSLLGGGHRLTEAAVQGEIFVGPAVILLVTRLLFVHFSYATGAAGGIFAPLLSLGALLGVISFAGTSYFIPNGPGVAACVVAGMCGLFSGVVRAPLTGIILIAEMTGSYDMLLPLLASAFTAYAVAEGVRDVPIYEALLQRDALTKGWNLSSGDLQMAEFELRHGSQYIGKSIRNLGLPEGALIILVRSAGKDKVPRSDMKLQEHMRIVVAVSTQTQLKLIAEATRSGAVE